MKRVLVHKYKGNHPIIRAYFENWCLVGKESNFYDFWWKIQQSEVDQAFLKLEELLDTGGNLQQKVWFVSIDNDFPYKAFIKVADRIYLRMDTGKTKFVCPEMFRGTIKDYTPKAFVIESTLYDYLERLAAYAFDEIYPNRMFEREFVRRYVMRNKFRVCCEN